MLEFDVFKCAFFCDNVDEQLRGKPVDLLSTELMLRAPASAEDGLCCCVADLLLRVAAVAVAAVDVAALDGRLTLLLAG